MDFLVYHKLQNVETSRCLVCHLEKDFEDVFACGELTTIKSGTANNSAQDVIQSIRTCLKLPILNKEDIIYIFFAGENQQMKLWPLKRKGRSKMHRLEADFPDYQI